MEDAAKERRRNQRGVQRGWLFGGGGGTALQRVQALSVDLQILNQRSADGEIGERELRRGGGVCWERWNAEVEVEIEVGGRGGSNGGEEAGYGGVWWVVVWKWVIIDMAQLGRLARRQAVPRSVLFPTSTGYLQHTPRGGRKERTKNFNDREALRPECLESASCYRG